MTQPPPSRWSVIAAFALVGAAAQILWLNFAGVTTVAAEHYGVSENAIGWLAQVFPLCYVVLAIPAGLVLDRWFRAGLAAGATLTAVGAGLRLVGDGYGWLLAGQVVAAVAQPLVLNAITGVTGHYLVAKDQPAGIAAPARRRSSYAGMVIDDPSGSARVPPGARPASHAEPLIGSRLRSGAAHRHQSAACSAAAATVPGSQRPGAAPRPASAAPGRRGQRDVTQAGQEHCRHRGLRMNPFAQAPQRRRVPAATASLTCPGTVQRGEVSCDGVPAPRSRARSRSAWCSCAGVRPAAAAAEHEPAITHAVVLKVAGPCRRRQCRVGRSFATR